MITMTTTRALRPGFRIHSGTGDIWTVRAVVPSLTYNDAGERLWTIAYIADSGGGRRHVSTTAEHEWCEETADEAQTALYDNSFDTLVVSEASTEEALARYLAMHEHCSHGSCAVSVTPSRRPGWNVVYTVRY